MSAVPSTRPSLLLRIRDAENHEAWQAFVLIYTPLIYNFCKKHGLQDADAADVAQEVMTAVARGIHRFDYDPQRGKFRSWLLTVTRNKFQNFLAKQQAQPVLAERTTLAIETHRQSAETEESEWDTEYYKRLFNWAADRIRHEFHESTWQAFWRATVDERDGKEVAESLGLSVGAVYVAKSRVVARLKEEIQAVDQEGIIPPDLPERE
jgi:RNA polymerase sigma factor (sigma-70 family)